MFALYQEFDAPQEDPAQWTMEYSSAQDDALREFRATYVRRLLELHGGNVSRAATTAGVSRRTLHRWLAQLNAGVQKERL